MKYGRNVPKYVGSGFGGALIVCSWYTSFTTVGYKLRGGNVFLCDTFVISYFDLLEEDNRNLHRN